MMDGTIIVQSEEKSGATFFLYLYGVDISSVIHSDESQENIEDKEQIVFSPAKILIVDDIEDNRALIYHIFEESHIEIVTASNGLEAIEAYKVYKPDLILMDIRMPKMDGYETARQIREMSDVPIIALTASVMKDEYERHKSESFDSYLRKPILKETLFTELSHYLSYENETREEPHTHESEHDVWNGIKEEDKEAIKSYFVLTIAPLFDIAKPSNNMTDIQQFNVALGALTKEHEIASLKDYVRELSEAIDTFDIVSIKSLLQTYPQLALRFI